MKRCINCGRFPFCCKIKNSQQESCEEFVKRKLGIEVTVSKNLKQRKRNK